jgi:hypothetical protein
MAKLTLTRARQAELRSKISDSRTPEFDQWIRAPFSESGSTFKEYVDNAIISDAKRETLYEATVVTENEEHAVLTFGPFITLKTLNERQAQAHKEERPVNITFFTDDAQGLVSLDAGRVESVTFSGKTLENVDILASDTVRSYFEEGAKAVEEAKAREGLERLLKAVEEVPDEDDEDTYEDDDDEQFFHAPEVAIVPSKLILTQKRQNQLLTIIEDAEYSSRYTAEYVVEPEYEKWLDDETYQGSFSEYVLGATIEDATKEEKDHSCECGLRHV